MPEITSSFGNFDPSNPDYQVYLLARRIDALVKEKEELEKIARNTEDRLIKIESESKAHFGLDDATIKWLSKADEDKLKRIDAAIQFMDNAAFMSKWTWLGIGIMATTISGVYWVYNNLLRGNFK